MERVQFDPNGGCWLWDGSIVANGYGVMKYEGRRVLVHRYMLAQKLGTPIPQGHYACHKCDVPSCVNPDHLYAGTPAQNVWDTHSRRRNAAWRNTVNITERFRDQQHYIDDHENSREELGRERNVKENAARRAMGMTMREWEDAARAAGNEDTRVWIKCVVAAAARSAQ